MRKLSAYPNLLESRSARQKSTAGRSEPVEVCEFSQAATAAIERNQGKDDGCLARTDRVGR